ncbi:Signal peptidase I [Alloactinosynnema sp. L-07]|uniref:signal peptidase I n=1 Tax=Alloactinosynnema sp. L-07 TaxID=1653480 RepID=UPI00065EFBA5|nr:signal peptidase I [Alloactinosynnema sp. L-07]CRK58713.1 Signal peptidase I [Alloactinosynnema sp. L-07]
MTTSVDPRGNATVARRILIGFGVLLVGSLVALVVAITLSQKIDGSSMRPSFGDGDRVLLEPFFDSADLQRFDVVAARPTPGAPAIVKRVIGLPGDRVRVEVRPDGTGALHLLPSGASRWQTVETRAWAGQWKSARACCLGSGKAGQDAEAVVPAGSVFLLGDNPDQSDDSRAYGWIRKEQVLGRLWLRIYPLGEFGSLDQTGGFRLTPKS